jgi:hypothetical protein
MDEDSPISNVCTNVNDLCEFQGKVERFPISHVNDVELPERNQVFAYQLYMMNLVAQE